MNHQFLAMNLGVILSISSMATYAGYPTLSQAKIVMESVNTNRIDNVVLILDPFVCRMTTVRDTAPTQQVAEVESYFLERILALPVVTNSDVVFQHEASSRRRLMTDLTTFRSFRSDRTAWMRLATELARFEPISVTNFPMLLEAARQADEADLVKTNVDVYGRGPRVGRLLVERHHLRNFNVTRNDYRHGLWSAYGDLLRSYLSSISSEGAVTSFTNDFIRAAKLTPEEVKAWFPPEKK